MLAYSHLQVTCCLIYFLEMVWIYIYFSADPEQLSDFILAVNMTYSKYMLVSIAVNPTVDSFGSTAAKYFKGYTRITAELQNIILENLVLSFHSFIYTLVFFCFFYLFFSSSALFFSEVISCFLAKKFFLVALELFSCNLTRRDSSFSIRA